LATWQRITPTLYRFTLKEARFHNGMPLTARDVYATYSSVLQGSSPLRSTLGNIASLEVRDRRTLDFTLQRPDPLFPGKLTLGILPAPLIEKGHPFHQRPVGSGPFAFVDWPEENRLRLRRLEDGQLFEFLRVPDPTVRVLKLLKGEIHMLQNDLPPELIAYLKRRKGVYLLRGKGSNFTYLGFNLQDPVVGEKRVRQAIAYAIDRPAIIRYLLKGAAREASAMLPPEHWAGNPDLPSYPYDPAKARALLQGRSPSITYKTSSDPFRLRLATVIQHQLAQVGIRVDLRSYDWGTFYGDIKAGRFQMYSLSWVGIKTPDIFRYVFHSASIPPRGANRGRFSDPEVDRLIEAAEAAPTLEAQALLYRKLQRLLWEALPYVPLWYEDHVFAARRGVSGYTIALDGNYDGLRHVHFDRSGKAVP
ncbi:MAG: ABC transporter substrate-binding protein, partial [Gammaproteobacteria bacterium]